jgi:hypothetical protein
LFVSIFHQDSKSYTTLERSRKNVSLASKISSPSVLSYDTNTSKVSEKYNPHDFYPRNLNHLFSSKSNLEGYRNIAKKELEENQNHVGEKLHQEPDLPVTFMKIFKGVTRTKSTVNDERRQVLPSKFIWGLES